MTLQQLRYLAAIVECNLNISAAAQKLHTSQPGVSRQIRVLESELGFELFVREGRALKRLTQPGQRVVERAQRILRESQAIKGMSLDAPKTKLLVDKLKGMGLDSVLVITDGVDENLWLASRNLPNVLVVEARNADPVSLVHFDKVLITKPALDKVQEMLA